MKRTRAIALFIALTLLPFNAVGSGQWAVSSKEQAPGNVEHLVLTAHRPLPAAHFSPQPYSRRPSKEALKWADGELKKMSLDEKIGQLISIGINATFLNRESDAYKALRRQVEENHVGGIILFASPVYESAILVNRMQQYARRPLLISADLERGAGMRFERYDGFRLGDGDRRDRQSRLRAPDGRD